VLGDGNYRQYLHGLNGQGQSIDDAGYNVSQPHHHQEPGRIEAADCNIADGEREERTEVTHGPGKLAQIEFKGFYFHDLLAIPYLKENIQRTCEVLYNIAASENERAKGFPNEVLDFKSRCSRL